MLAAVLAGLAVLVAVPGPVARTRRLTALQPSAPVVRGRVGAPAACVLAGAGVAAAFGWPAGVLPGLAVAVAGPRLLSRLEPAAARREREQLTRELPLVLDLLAACLSGGSSLPAAAAAVAEALPGPSARRLVAVADALAVGTPPAEAWSALADGRSDDPLAGAARTLGRAADAGTPLSGAMARSAAEARAAERAAGAVAARRVGVIVVAPLGLCFLPAFVLIGIVPVVVGLAGPLLRTF
jgi:pilus assembly protein TadC